MKKGLIVAVGVVMALGLAASVFAADIDFWATTDSLYSEFQGAREIHFNAWNTDAHSWFDGLGNFDGDISVRIDSYSPYTRLDTTVNAVSNSPASFMFGGWQTMKGQPTRFYFDVHAQGSTSAEMHATMNGSPLIAQLGVSTGSPRYLVQAAGAGYSVGFSGGMYRQKWVNVADPGDPPDWQKLWADKRTMVAVRLFDDPDNPGGSGKIGMQGYDAIMSGSTPSSTYNDDLYTKTPSDSHGHRTYLEGSGGGFLGFSAYGPDSLSFETGLDMPEGGELNNGATFRFNNTINGWFDIETYQDN